MWIRWKRSSESIRNQLENLESPAAGPKKAGGQPPGPRFSLTRFAPGPQSNPVETRSVTHAGCRRLCPIGYFARPDLTTKEPRVETFGGGIQASDLARRVRPEDLVATRPGLRYADSTQPAPLWGRSCNRVFHVFSPADKMTTLPLRSSSVKLGLVPTHLKFVGGLVPDEQGRLPREESGRLKVVANLESIQQMSPVAVSQLQVPYFPGIDEADVNELVAGIRAAGADVHFIMMVSGGDPMNPTDEDQVVQLLVDGLQAAQRLQIRHVSSTSLEAWMAGQGGRLEGAELDQAVAQLVRVHTRAVEEAQLDGQTIQAWHLEFLRQGEFQTFTDLSRVWRVARESNQALGRTFFKILVDAAHCGDSALTIPENEALIAEIAAAGEMGIFHASAKTTRGCLSTDDGWIGALLAAAAATGQLEYVFVECFHHEDPALAGLRELDSRHGVDTTDGRSYDQMVIDGLVNVAHRLNNLVVRGILN